MGQITGAAGTMDTGAARLRKLALGMIDLGFDDRQIMMVCNRLVSDARARQQTFKGESAKFWRAEVAKWTNVKIEALSLSKKFREDAEEEAAVAAANSKELVNG